MFKTIEYSEQPTVPLTGVKVLDLSRLVAGNTLTMCLSDFGAEVVKNPAQRTGL